MRAMTHFWIASLVQKSLITTSTTRYYGLLARTFLTGLQGLSRADSTWCYCSVQSSPFFILPSIPGLFELCLLALLTCFEDIKGSSKSRREAGFALLQTLLRLISEVKLGYFPSLQATHTLLCVQNFGEGINSSCNHTVTWEGCQGAAFHDVLMRWSLKYTWKCLCQEHLRKVQLITDYNG